MTYLEVLWAGKKVLVTSIKSKSGAIHMRHRRFVGRTGTVLRETKHGMLLVQFEFKKRYAATKCIGIPVSCLTEVE